MTVLKSQYLRYNRDHFRNRLPSNTMVKWATIPDMGDFCDEGGRMTIRINRLLRRWPSAWKETLLHEMCHAATREEVADHGPAWVRERRRLYEEGVFEPLI